jgi:short-subunit dehydrogenase
VPGLTDFRDRVAVVTGASSGIGAQLARDLAGRGMRVVLVARRLDRLQALAGELGDDRALPLACDVGERGDVERTIERAAVHWKRLDLLVNAAGYNNHVLFKDHDVEDIERMMRVNYLGVVWAIKAALPHMRARHQGWIVNLSSLAGKLGQPDEAAYSASKFAITGLSEALSYELAPLGIHVLTVYPALVRTEMFTPGVLARMPERVKRTFVEPAEFTRTVLRALERGRYEVTVPERYAVAYLARLLFPGFHRRMTAQLRLSVLPDVTS